MAQPGNEAPCSALPALPLTQRTSTKPSTPCRQPNQDLWPETACYQTETKGLNPSPDHQGPPPGPPKGGGGWIRTTTVVDPQRRRAGTATAARRAARPCGQAALVMRWGVHRGECPVSLGSGVERGWTEAGATGPAGMGCPSSVRQTGVSGPRQRGREPGTSDERQATSASKSICSTFSRSKTSCLVRESIAVSSLTPSRVTYRVPVTSTRSR